jgi:hypothetical protein
VLAFALVLPGSLDPVEGIVDGVRVELAAVAEMLQEHNAGSAANSGSKHGGRRTRCAAPLFVSCNQMLGGWALLVPFDLRRFR